MPAYRVLRLMGEALSWFFLSSSFFSSYLIKPSLPSSFISFIVYILFFRAGLDSI
jgi:hypothetical protein